MPTFAVSTSLEDAPKVLSNITDIKIPTAFSDCTKYFLIQIKDDTMEPFLEKGSSVVVAKGTSPAKGTLSFVCANINHITQYIVAYYFLDEERIILKSVNANYDDIVVDQSDLISAEAIVYVCHQ